MTRDLSSISPQWFNHPRRGQGLSGRWAKDLAYVGEKALIRIALLQKYRETLFFEA